MLPNAKSDMLGVSWGGDLTGLSTATCWPTGSSGRKIEEIYRNHALGWLYYIQTEGGSPQWGLPEDEFKGNGNFPYQLYVRQGRRIEGLDTFI